MSTIVSPLAGKPASSVAAAAVDVGALLAAYVDLQPDPGVPAQRVAFGTSGHRGSSLARSFNEWHVLAISQAICEYRHAQGIDGPLFLGIDTHALSAPAFRSALEVLAGNGVETMISAGGEFTPTPAVSHAILAHNRDRDARRADGIVITPSHNPPEDGGFKYNPPNGGPADTGITAGIEARANALLQARLRDVRRMPYEQALHAATTHTHDYLGAYVADLDRVIDFDPIRGAGVRMGVDPLGGAGVHYWARIGEHYRVDLAVVSEQVDPAFQFMSLDWDGRIRMDPSSSYAMRRLIEQRERYDIAFACDTDHDRHGIVTRSAGLLPTNHYLSVMIDYLFRHRPGWAAGAGIGKTVVSSAMIDRVAARLGRRLLEVPVGFKWFVAGLLDGSLAFGGEESAGATFSRIDGSAWTTDKDGIVPCLLAAEITARTGSDPGQCYAALARELGEPVGDRVEAPATPEQKARLSRLSPAQVPSTQLAPSGWFAARPSGTENIYKIYAESFQGRGHLDRLLGEAQQIVDKALAA
jgi:phosphoglucomutase